MLNLSTEQLMLKVGLSESEYMELLDEVYVKETDKPIKEKIINYYNSLTYKEKEIFRLIGPDFVLDEKDADVRFLVIVKLHDTELFKRIIANAREKIKE